MRIQTKVILLVATLLCLVVGSISVNLFWFTQRQVQANSMARIDVMMNSVVSIAKESLRADDELMLLSYLKNMVKEYPEIKLALVRRKGHSTVVGQLQEKIYYRTVAVSAGLDTAGKLDELSIQIGFSQPELDNRIKQEGALLLKKILQSSAISFFLGLLGAWVVGRKIAAPITAIATKMRGSWEAKLLKKAEVAGDEIGYLEAQYKTMSAKIAEAAQFKEDLLLTLTHELNNPLAGLKGLLWGLQSPKACENPEAVQADCKIMSDAVNVMELSLSNTIQLFKLRASPALRRERVLVNDIMAQVLQLLRPAAQVKSLTLEEDIPPDPIYVSGDPEMVRRIIINLVSNACKYTPSGGTVGVKLAESGGNIQIAVSDNGPGIAAQDREALFTKFYRVPGPDGKHQRIPGSGLGLAITKQAVELHQGRIWVDSEKGKGSVFNVVLPKGL
ncbi:MAG TPA: HAMP domain-containing sensor histidine kinase [Elusimicrobiales bacterium]|nr:HAMP domain-containing sensor histidine kinase [Elusimicrobiales bacterium]